MSAGVPPVPAPVSGAAVAPRPGPAPRMRALRTARLRLEPQRAAHADEMFQVLSDPAIYTYENAPPTSLQATFAITSPITCSGTRTLVRMISISSSFSRPSS